MAFRNPARHEARRTKNLAGNALLDSFARSRPTLAGSSRFAESLSMYNQNEKVEKVNVAEEMSKSFLDYSMSVIISRALPDARDGLKPSQRRILYAMNDLGVQPNRKHLKCAKIVGETMGNYHPHGDQAIYPTLVHMAQPWAMREMLIDGQGNFGSVEGDPPASMRYTEARLQHLGAALMDGHGQGHRRFRPELRRDARRSRPSSQRPSRICSSMAAPASRSAWRRTCRRTIWAKCIDGVCAQIDDPDITIEGLMEFVKGPDFPTGCILQGTAGIKQYFETGRGAVRVRGRVGVAEVKGGREQIIITEIPYNVNRAELVKRIADLVNEKVLTGISDVRDESAEDTRVVIDLKRDGNPKVIINNLYKHTALESSFSVNMLAIDHGKPKLLSLKDAIACYIEHRREVVLRRTRFLLREAEDEAEKLEALLIALAQSRRLHPDHPRLPRPRRREGASCSRSPGRGGPWSSSASSSATKRGSSTATTSFTEKQVGRDPRPAPLPTHRPRAGQHQGRIRRAPRDDQGPARHPREGEARAEDHQGRAARDCRRNTATERRTQIVPAEGEISIEDLIANEGCIITITHNGFIKRTAVSAYRAQRRGGKGVIGMTAREAENEEDSDFVEHLFTATTHDYLMFFTQDGRCYVERVFEIPGDEPRQQRPQHRELPRAAQRGKDRRDHPHSGPEERTRTRGATSCTSSSRRRSGIVKKSNLSDFKNIRKGGIIAIKIEEGDRLIDAQADQRARTRSCSSPTAA